MPQPDYRTTPTDTERMPGGIPYIVGNEAAERFSYYGMRAILVVFMTKHLLASDGSLDVMTDERAKMWFHVFSMAVYFFPAIGAIISDVYLGKYRTILTLSIVYCLGHLALALDETRVGLSIGLTLIAIGSGGIKPCVSAHVGDQFGPSNQQLLPRVFSWFYFSINLGAFVSMLLTPILLERVGPQLAFGLPGALMLMATWVFWWGRNSFIHVSAGGWGALNDLKDKSVLKTIAGLIVVYLFVAPFWALFDQSSSAWVLQARRMDLNFMGHRWLPSQVGSINSVFVLCLIPLFSYVVYPQISRFFPLTALRKISIGLFVTAAAFGVSALIESRITGGEVIPGTVEGDSAQHSSDNLIDNEFADNGWVSPVWKFSQPAPEKTKAEKIDTDETDTEQTATEKTRTPLDILIRLREHRPWPLASIGINPAADIKSFLQSQQAMTAADTAEISKQEISADDLQSCYAKEIEILAGDGRDVSTFQSLGHRTLEHVDRLQTFQLAGKTDKGNPIQPEAKYVMVRIHSNHGGKYVCLKQIQVNTSVAEPTAAGVDVWPDVASIGHKPWIAWQLWAYLIITAAEVMVSITCLEFSYTQAPARLKSIVMALFFFSISLGNAFTAAVNFFIENKDGSSKLEGASYYWFFAAVMLVTAIGFVVVALFYHEKPHIMPTGHDGPLDETVADMGQI